MIPGKQTHGIFHVPFDFQLILGSRLITATDRSATSHNPSTNARVIRTIISGLFSSPMYPLSPPERDAGTVDRVGKSWPDRILTRIIILHDRFITMEIRACQDCGFIKTGYSEVSLACSVNSRYFHCSRAPVTQIDEYVNKSRVMIFVTFLALTWPRV